MLGKWQCHLFFSVDMQVNDVKTDLSQIGFDIESIQQMVAALVSL